MKSFKELRNTFLGKSLWFMSNSLMMFFVKNNNVLSNHCINSEPANQSNLKFSLIWDLGQPFRLKIGSFKTFFNLPMLLTFYFIFSLLIKHNEVKLKSEEVLRGKSLIDILNWVSNGYSLIRNKITCSAPKMNLGYLNYISASTAAEGSKRSSSSKVHR